MRLPPLFEGIPGELTGDIDRPKALWTRLTDFTRGENSPILHSQTRWTTSRITNHAGLWVSRDPSAQDQMNLEKPHS